MNCKSCGAPITFITSEKGRKTPVNFPGDMRLVVDAAGVARRALTYTSHFKTCPHASQHSRGSR